MNLLAPPRPAQTNRNTHYYDPSRPLESGMLQYTAGMSNQAEQARFAAEQRRYEAGQRELTRRTGEIDRRMVDDIAAAGTAQSNTLNTAALAGERRRAGGGSFRRRGSGVSANQLVSGLGAANARALAAQRRAIARREVAAGVGWYQDPRAPTSTYNPASGGSGGSSNNSLRLPDLMPTNMPVYTVYN